ncbi:MAG: CDP-alcohol phosphatidyltransferase family protein [Planctomycetes bacterium]|nr:CDP-alcohol phosphatidyltransferase family protein [Planctomycetota bacterium]
MEDLNKKGIIRYVPNALTIGRVVMTVIIMALIIHAPSVGEKPADLLLGAFILFVITGLTDIVDGYLARKFEVTSKFGRTVDPLADKFLVCGAFFCFAWVNQPKMACFDFSEMTLDVIRWGTAIIIFAREIIVQTLRHIAESRGVQFGAIWSGKLKMFLQSFGIGTVIIGWAYVSRPWGDWFTIITYALMVFMTVFSGIQSLTRRIK